MITPTEQYEITDARNILEAHGFVVLREKSYRRAQERQRMAEVMRANAVERAESQDKWWREHILPELFEYRDRVTFLYGAARAAGCTVEDLRGPDGRVLAELDAIDQDDETEVTDADPT